MIYVFLADGFEETEALATIDVLRRAELPVTTVGIGKKNITGSHQITVIADMEEAEFKTEDLEAVVLPGGMPGTRNLEASGTVQKAIRYAAEHDKYLCAICAAPSVLGNLGLLDGKRATCFPGFEVHPRLVQYTGEPAVADGRIITGKGAGCAVQFGLKIAEVLKSAKAAKEVKESMQCPW